jgi:hypothetical protein
LNVLHTAFAQSLKISAKSQKTLFKAAKKLSIPRICAEWKLKKVQFFLEAVGELSSEEEISVFERNAADFAAIMGFTAKNLTKLQPQRLVFSTDYKSLTGSKGCYYPSLIAHRPCH